MASLSDKKNERTEASADFLTAWMAIRGNKKREDRSLGKVPYTSDGQPQRQKPRGPKPRQISLHLGWPSGARKTRGPKPRQISLHLGWPFGAIKSEGTEASPDFLTPRMASLSDKKRRDRSLSRFPYTPDGHPGREETRGPKPRQISSHLGSPCGAIKRGGRSLGRFPYTSDGQSER